MNTSTPSLSDWLLSDWIGKDIANVKLHEYAQEDHHLTYQPITHAATYVTPYSNHQEQEPNPCPSSQAETVNLDHQQLTSLCLETRYSHDQLARQIDRLAKKLNVLIARQS